MKNLKLLNKKYLSFILFYLFFGLVAQSQEPIDIWNIEEKKISDTTDIIDKYFLFNNFKFFIWDSFFNFFIRRWEINFTQQHYGTNNNN